MHYSNAALTRVFLKLKSDQRLGKDSGKKKIKNQLLIFFNLIIKILLFYSKI